MPANVFEIGTVFRPEFVKHKHTELVAAKETENGQPPQIVKSDSSRIFPSHDLSLSLAVIRGWPDSGMENCVPSAVRLK
jgi:hypothetical protein